MATRGKRSILVVQEVDVRNGVEVTCVLFRLVGQTLSRMISSKVFNLDTLVKSCISNLDGGGKP